MVVVVWAIIVFGFFAQMAFFAMRSTLYCRSKSLNERLEVYAMSSDLLDGKGKAVFGEGLKSGQHKILLGILKKVEAKNGTLFQAWTFAAAGSVAVSIPLDNDVLDYRPFAAAFLLLALPFIFASLRGMRQIDQLDFPVFAPATVGVEVAKAKLAKAVQDKLRDDLLVKEACFDFSWKGAFLMLGIGIFCYASSILLKMEY